MDEPRILKMRARVKIDANALFTPPVQSKQEKTEQKKPEAKKEK